MPQTAGKAARALHEAMRTWLHAMTVLIAALALLGTAGYFAVSSVVAQETRELRDQVLAMQGHVSKIPSLESGIAALQQQGVQHDAQLKAILDALKKLQTSKSQESD